MSSDEQRAVLRVPAREIPVPTTVSPQAQAFLAMGPIEQPTVFPAADDLEGWRALVASNEALVPTVEAREGMGLAIGGGTDPTVKVEVEQIDVDGVPVFVATPEGWDADDDRVYLNIHGGGFISGGGDACRSNAAGTAASLRTRVWGVDYRMPPNHPFPTPLNDCLTVYRHLVATRAAGHVAVGGISAGGYLTATTLLKARDEGLEMPAAAVICTPPTDLTASGDTLRTNEGIDTVVVNALEPVFALMAAGHDLHDPHLSPLFGDFTKGFAPTALFSGTRDKLLSDTVRLHRALRKAGIEADLHVFEAAPHGMFLGTAPEDAERSTEIRRFLAKHWGDAR